MENVNEEMALVLLQTLPAVAGLLLVFLVYAVTRLLEVQHQEGADKKEVQTYVLIARLAAGAVFVNIFTTVAVWGWLQGWWHDFGILTSLFLVSLGAVGVLTLVSLTRVGPSGRS